MEVQHIYIVGSKGCGNYGGYETFLDKLTEYHQNNKKIKYHIAWKGCSTKEFEYNGAHAFQIKVPDIGSAQAILYDIAALNYCLKHIKNNHIKNPIIYILACRIGPFAAYYQKKVHKFHGKLYVNPDGHEWMRTKWSFPVRKYWKISEQLMVKYSDILVCDSKNIEKYIQKNYKKYSPKTIYIAYGAETKKSLISDDNQTLINWYKEKGLSKKDYYLAVGRFVPENNYEIMIKEFMKSNSRKSFAIITTTDKNFLDRLEKKLHFKQDSRIKFVGTVYDKELLRKIRENAYGYFHGHEVGGTNPSLLEALGSTNLNLLLNVAFNREVAENSALYWNKLEGSLAKLINIAEKMSENEIAVLGNRAKERILNEYSWPYIAHEYETLFLMKYNGE